MKIKKISAIGNAIIMSFLGLLCCHATAQTLAEAPAQLAAKSIVVPSSEPLATFTQPPWVAEEFVLLVSQLEEEYGPFDYRLGEALQAAGGAWERQGEFSQALLYYERALHVTRINSGLYSPDQISIVESLINSNIALENWAVVDDHFRYLHLLYSRVYPEDSPELRRGLVQIADWHILAINNDLGTDRIDHLREANKLFRKRLNLVEKELPDDDPGLQTLRYNIAVTQYHLQVASGGGSHDGIFARIEEQYEDQLAALD